MGSPPGDEPPTDEQSSHLLFLLLLLLFLVVLLLLLPLLLAVINVEALLLCHQRPLLLLLLLTLGLVGQMPLFNSPFCLLSICQSSSRSKRISGDSDASSVASFFLFTLRNFTMGSGLWWPAIGWNQSQWAGLDFSGVNPAGLFWLQMGLLVVSRDATDWPRWIIPRC